MIEAPGLFTVLVAEKYDFTDSSEAIR